MRLSPISHSGLSACSGKTSASKRCPCSVPQTQVPAPAGPPRGLGDLQVEANVQVVGVRRVHRSFSGFVAFGVRDHRVRV